MRATFILETGDKFLYRVDEKDYASCSAPMIGLIERVVIIHVCLQPVCIDPMRPGFSISRSASGHNLICASRMRKRALT